jgi:hypothetical protein
LAKTVYLHLGLHKTATGWLQRQFFPRLGLPLYRTRKLERIAGLAVGAPADRIIVSHEGLGGRISDDKAPGDSLRMFQATLDGIAELPATTKLLVGFREQSAWIGSAYAQRGKKATLTPEAYRDTYSRDDLLWMKRVRLGDERGLESFLFLYEEFAQDPVRLCEDLCRFLGVTPPEDMASLLARRENPSPKTEGGLRMSRAAYALTRVLGALPFVDAKRLRRAASEFGASFDSDEAPIKIGLGEQDEAVLGRDWEELVREIGERRARDFSAFLPQRRAIKSRP